METFNYPQNGQVQCERYLPFNLVYGVNARPENEVKGYFSAKQTMAKYRKQTVGLDGI